MSSTGRSLYEMLRSAAAFPFQYDVASGQVMLVSLAADTLAGAAFLDQRVLTQSSDRSTVSISDFEAAAAKLPTRIPNFIFHQGHCGSTLLSRLIASATASSALREPLVLRSFASLLTDVDVGDAALTSVAATQRLLLFLRCFAQVAGPPIVKASSICTDLAAPLMGADPIFRALFVFVQPDVFLATMLAGQSNRADMTAFGAIRRRRLRNRGIATPPLYELSEGQLAALAWLCEAVSFDAVPDNKRFMTIDFDLFLASPLPALESAALHLGVPAAAGAAATAINGPVMRTYSKAQQHQYSPGLRAEILKQSKRDFASEIAAGLNWLSDLAAGSEIVKSAMRRLCSADPARKALPTSA